MLRIALCFVLLLAGLARPLHAEVTAEQVRGSIEKGIAYLKEKQSREGDWVDQPGFPGGGTLLVTLALLTAGESPEEPHVAKALARAEAMTPDFTYTVSLQTMVLAQANPKKYLVRIQKNAEWLEKTQIKDGPRAGAWAYPSERGGGGDNSNSQFALLALFEAQRAGAKVSNETWTLALAYWKKSQNNDGSWGYFPGLPGTGSMTCAGISAVVICSARLSEGDAQVRGEEVLCCGQQDRDDTLQRALAWLGRNFSVHTNPSAHGGLGGQNWLLYYLYGVERVGRMTAQRFIGEHDWYREGAEMFVAHQDALTGAWKGVGHAEQDEIIATSLSLLFMAKGRRPVLLAKAKYGDGSDWNNHRSDVANLTSYVEKKWERDLTWQVVEVEKARVEDLLQAPVLFLSGSQSFAVDDAQVRLLRDYIDRGGFIFAEACCSQSDGFDAAFRGLMARVFPEPEYRLRPLPPSHPVYYAEEQVSLDRQYVLEGVDYGCRTSVVYAPPPTADGPSSNLSCLWELSQGRSQQYAQSVKASIQAANSIGINVLAYATNREVKSKEENFLTPVAELPPDQVDRSMLYVAKLRHPGACDAAPGALTNLLKSVGNELQVRVNTDARQIAMTDENLFRYHLVFMHGRQAFRLTDAERKQLRLYVERGGTILADAICANREFAKSFRREMAIILPEQQLSDIPADDPMFTSEFGGFDLEQVSRREPQQQGARGPLKAFLRRGPPQLEGIRIGDRWAVIFSKYDLSCALEKHDSLECEGYTRDDAERIGLNAILYSLHQ